MPATVDTMTDLQLDITLEHCFAQHKDAEPGRRAVIHRCTMDVLAEQAKRRDVALRLGATYVASLTS